MAMIVGRKGHSITYDSYIWNKNMSQSCHRWKLSRLCIQEYRCGFPFVWESLVKSLINQRRESDMETRDNGTDSHCQQQSHSTPEERTSQFFNILKWNRTGGGMVGPLIGFHIFPSNVSQIMIINQELKKGDTFLLWHGKEGIFQEAWWWIWRSIAEYALI